MTSNSTTKSILAVDDELDIVNVIKYTLEANGVKVCTFTDALTALEHLNQIPDIIS
jgi:CheY-like chemotaxis protein